MADVTAPELARRLSDLWATLDALDATVHRRPINLHRALAHTLAVLCARETERVRVLTSPEAAPVLARRREVA